MEHVDFAPSDRPSLDQQRQALTLGLGRALQWASTGKLKDDTLLHACLHDLRHQPRYEFPRGGWLMQILEATGRRAILKEKILQSTLDQVDERDVEQLADLAHEFAANGDESFRRLLYRLCLEHRNWRAAEAVLVLDGEAGLCYVARTLGDDPGEWSGQAAHLFSSACSLIGRERAESVLDKLSHPNVQAFRDSIQRYLVAMQKYEAEFMERIAAPQLKKSECREPGLADAQMSTAESGETSPANSEMVAKKNPSFENIVHRWTGSYLLRGPLGPGDEGRIFEELVLPADPQERPAFFRDILEALRWNDAVDVTRFAMAAYSQQPNPSVRGDAAILLRARGAAPLWLLDECRFDCACHTSGYFAGVWEYDQWRRRRAAGETTDDYPIFSDE